MPVNRFERPIQNQYNFQQFVPNFEAWDQLMGGVQQEVNQVEALMAKNPNYITWSQSDQAGAQEYRGMIGDIRSNLADSFMTGASKGRLAMNSAMYQIMEQWSPGGLASQLESRLTEQTAREEELRKLFENNPNELPYAMALNRAGIDPLRNQSGAYQGVGFTPTPAPMDAEAFSKWMSDNNKDIAETLLNDQIIRRHLTGNNYESVQDIILETRGKTAERVFQVLASMVPDEFKSWYQFKHEAMSYNSGGTYQPGDQTKLYNIRTVTDPDTGAQVQVVDPNLDSELGRMLWAKANGAAYIEHVRTTAKLTDYAAKKRAELREEFPYTNPNVAGAAIATKVGGAYHDVKTFSDLFGVQSAQNSMVDDARGDIYSRLARVAEGDQRKMQAYEQRLGNIETQLLNNSMTDDVARAQLANMGVSDETVDTYINSVRQKQFHDDTVNQMIDRAQQITGIDLRDLNGKLIDAGVSGNIETTNGGSLPIVQILTELATGDGKLNSYTSVSKAGGTMFYTYVDAHGNVHDIPYRAYKEITEMQEEADISQFMEDVKYANNTLGLKDMFSGEYVVQTEIPMYIPHADKDGVVSMKASEAYTQAFEKLMNDPRTLQNYIFFDPKNPSSRRSISILDQLSDLPVTDKGAVDWDAAGLSVKQLQGAVPGFGWAMSVSYTDAEGVPRQNYIKAAREPVELLMTNGRTFDQLTAPEYARVTSDSYFNNQLQEYSRTFAQWNPRLGDMEVSARDIHGLPVGRFVFTPRGSSPVTRTDQGGPTAPHVIFEYEYVDKATGKTRQGETSIENARDIYYALNFGNND